MVRLNDGQGPRFVAHSPRWPLAAMWLEIKNMKLKALVLSVCVLAITWTGCWQKSIYPFYKDSDVIFETALLGTWVEPGKKPEDAQVWKITRGPGASAYQINVHSGETSLDYDVHLFKLGDNRFLDLYSRNRSPSDVPAHHLVRVGKFGATFEYRSLGLDGVKKWLEAHPKEIAYVPMPDPEHLDDKEKTELVLTASTDEVQKFIRNHLDTPEFYDDRVELKKSPEK